MSETSYQHSPMKDEEDEEPQPHEKSLEMMRKVDVVKHVLCWVGLISLLVGLIVGSSVLFFKH